MATASSAIATDPNPVTYPNLVSIDLASIPAVLKDRHQWILWCGADRVNKKTGEVTGLNKIPWTLDPDQEASSTNPATWTTFQRCVDALASVLEEWQLHNPTAYRGGGIGFVFTPQDPFCGVDLDHCRDTATGEIDPWAQDIVDQLQSYTQVSVSETGLHILIEGQLPPGRRQADDLQMWDQARFFAMTGQHLPGTPTIIAPRQAELDRLYAATFPVPEPATASRNGTSSLDDATILRKVRAASNSAKFQQLWDGDSSGYPSDSEADAALLGILAFYTQDQEQLARLFEQSSLVDDKWLKRPDYQRRTITKALENLQHRYQAPGAASVTVPGPQAPDPEAAPEPLEPGYEAEYPFSDAYNAQALILEYGKNLRYVPSWKTWLTWNGRFWERDTHNQTMRWQRHTVKALGKLLVETASKDDEKALLRHIASSLSTARIKAALEQAQSWQGISIPAESCDQDPWLLNCSNGTLDLRTGQLRPHRQQDYLTKSLTIPYEPEAQCPTWDHFLWRIMGGSQGEDTDEMSNAELEARAEADRHAEELISFLQRIVGYALTGSTREQCLFILYGITKTGKSTFLSILRALLGPYSQQADMGTFMKQQRDKIRNDVADLAGSRLVCAVESKENQKLAEALVKEMTGGSDELKARFLFQEHFTFKPQFKIFLGTNHKPVITDTDGAIWERIRLVPFNVQIPIKERDKNLEERLKQELPGILSWAVKGCLQWQALDELKEPDAVLDATAGYRTEQDVLAAFLKECCITTLQEAKTKSSLLFKAYQKWSEEAGEETLTQKAFSQRLENKGYTTKHLETGNFWQGIGLYTEEKKS